MVDAANPGPDVILDFIFDRGQFLISVENIGDSPACMVSVSFDRQIRGAGGARLVSDLPLFKRIEFMPPGKRIATFLDSSAGYFGSGQPVNIQATVDFRDRQGKTYRNVIKHDLSIYREIGYTLS